MTQRAPDISDALAALAPSDKWAVVDNDASQIQWFDGDATQPTTAEIEAKLVELQSAYNAKQYARDRALEYPSIGDQLDALFHAGAFPEGMAAQIQAVKNKYPKG